MEPTKSTPEQWYEIGRGIATIAVPVIGGFLTVLRRRVKKVEKTTKTLTDKAYIVVKDNGDVSLQRLAEILEAEKRSRMGKTLRRRSDKLFAGDDE